MLSAGCQGEQSKSFDHPLGQAFTRQIEQSCQADMVYHKTVYEKGQSNQAEDSTFRPVPLVPFGESKSGEDSTNYLLLRDLNYALEKYFGDTYTRELMQVTFSGDTTIAQVLPEKAKKEELQIQKIVMSPDSSLLLYLETQLDKRSWLYRMQVSISIQFDSLGRYHKHLLEVSTDVPLLREKLQTRVEGKGQY